MKIKNNFDKVTIKGLLSILLIFSLLIIRVKYPILFLDDSLQNMYVIFVVIFSFIPLYYAFMFLFRLSSPKEYQKFIKYK